MGDGVRKLAVVATVSEGMVGVVGSYPSTAMRGEDSVRKLDVVGAEAVAPRR